MMPDRGADHLGLVDAVYGWGSALATTEARITAGLAELDARALAVVNAGQVLDEAADRAELLAAAARVREERAALGRLIAWSAHPWRIPVPHSSPLARKADSPNED